MLPVNPEAIGLFGLIATVICFGLEQIGVGVKGADHTKLTTSLGLIAILFGGLAQIFTGLCMYLFSVLVGLFFLKGGDKKVIAHFFATGFILCVGFTLKAFQDGLVWPLGIDLIVIDVLLAVLVPAWYTNNPLLTKIAGICNLTIGIISMFLLFPAIGL